MRIALDGMGSDGFPEPEVLGAIQAVREFGWKIILTGNESQLRAALKRAAGAHLTENITVEHAPERVTGAGCQDRPRCVVRDVLAARGRSGEVGRRQHGESWLRGADPPVP